MSFFRCLSAAPQTQKRAENRAVADDKKPNMSFLTNIFRGEVQPAQVFPYPEVLDAEQKEYIAAFVDPVTRFFEVCLCDRVLLPCNEMTITN